MKEMRQGLWQKQRDDGTNHTTIDFTVCQAYKVSVIVLVLRVLNRGR